MRTLVVAVALVAGALVACSSSGSAPAVKLSGHPEAAHTDPCKLFDGSMLAKLFGGKLDAGKVQPNSIVPTCQWSTADNSLTVVATVRKATETSFGSDIAGPVGKDYQRTSPKVGDDSVWFDGSQHSPTQGSLLVISDHYLWQVVVTRPGGIGDARTKLLDLAAATF